VHDLAVVLSSALRVGAHGPAARNALARLSSRLDVHEASPASTIEAAIRRELDRGGGGEG
jgi:hypothetical protein